jgi:hypothetical protein
MRRRSLSIVMPLVLAAAACGPSELVVTVEIDAPNPDGEGMVTRALGDLEIQLLPYDRDAVFDSMATAFGTPEPPVPQDLIDARDQVREAQEEWQAAQNRWNTIRDTLVKLNDAMAGYSRGESRYVLLFKEWQEFDGELGGVTRQMERAFDRFNDLQKGTIRQADSVRIMRDNWADEAFAGVGEVFLAKQRASGLKVVIDTTDATGVVRIKAKAGSYWVHARYDLPYTELYWNVPVTLEGRDPQELRLTRANAKERIKL